MGNQKKCLLGLTIAILSFVVGISYAYFTATLQNLGIRETSITLAELGSLKLTASEATYTSGGQYPGDMAIQKFTVEPVSKGVGIYELDLTGVIDESIFGSDVEIQLYKSLDNTEVTITEGELTLQGENFSRVDTLVTNGLTPIYTGTLKNGLNLLYQEDFEVINQSGLKIRENSSSASYSKYTFFLVYNYKNNGNQNTQMGETFSGTISGKLITEKESPSMVTLGQLQSLNPSLELTINTSDNPNFAKTSPSFEEEFEESMYIDEVSAYPITYSDSYAYDSNAETYSLVNYTIGDAFDDIEGRFIIVEKIGNDYYSASGFNTPVYQTGPNRYLAKVTTVDIDPDPCSEDPDNPYCSENPRNANINIIVYIPAEEDQTSGLYELEDDYGTSYYFRGGVTNNYVKFGTWQTDYYSGYSSVNSRFEGFASLNECQNVSHNCEKNATAGNDMYWRIVRINGDGTIRMIYDGTNAYNQHDLEFNYRSLGLGEFNTSWDDNAYVGYMYGTSGSNNYNNTHANIYDSTIKMRLDSWYQSQMMGYSEYIADTLFCYDRSIASNDAIYYVNNNMEFEQQVTNNPYGTNWTIYSPYGRLIEEFLLDQGNKATLKCPQKHDAFTVSNTMYGNGNLTYPVGLITSDEINIAGGGKFINNEDYYLNIGRSFWTGSPSGYFEDDAYVYEMFNYLGILDENVVLSYDSYVRPVINLKGDAITGGSGTAQDPFVVE